LFSPLPRPPPCSTLFPYTTLFRSVAEPLRFVSYRLSICRRDAPYQSICERLQELPSIWQAIEWRAMPRLSHENLTSLRLNERYIKHGAIALVVSVDIAQSATLRPQP